jgi:hypothetical protein
MVQNLIGMPKIDSLATDGLDGVEDSLAYRVHEIERHLHNWERWFGAAGVPSGEVHVADRIGTTSTAFQADAGNVTWGAWLQILGSSDTPDTAGMEKYDLHRIQVTAVERINSVHFVQLTFGTSGAAGLAAGEYTEFVFHPQGQTGQRLPVPILDRRYDAGAKAWIRVMVPGQNTGTMDFFFGLHEYPG